MSSFPHRGSARRFQTCDLDGNEVHRAGGLRAGVGEHGGAEYGQADDVQGLARLRALMGGLWEHLMSIADTDGRLGVQDEVRWNRGSTARPEHVGKEVRRRLDTDEDGCIGVAEPLSAIREFRFDDSQGPAGEFLLGPLPERDARRPPGDRHRGRRNG